PRFPPKDSARGWLPALVLFLAPYRLGDPVNGLLQGPLGLVGVTFALQAWIPGQGTGGLLDASLRLVDVLVGHSPSWFGSLPGARLRRAHPRRPPRSALARAGTCRVGD